MSNEQTKEASATLLMEAGEDGKNPRNVQCAECKHVWVGLYLPQPISVAAKMMKNLTCPKCGTGSNRIRLAS